MTSELTQLLLDFSQHAAPLAHTESLEDFKQQARGVCSDVQFTPQQLNAVRGQLQALGSSSWHVGGEELADLARENPNLTYIRAITRDRPQREGDIQGRFDCDGVLGTDVRLQPAPNFSFSALGSSDERHLSDYKGKTVLLNFWASWCAPCIIEFPKLEELARTYPDTLVILALSADTEETDIHRFLKKYKHNEQKNFFVAHDKNKAISQDIFQTIRLPETIIIDPSGNMVRKVAGDTDWTGTDMKSYLSSLATPKSIP